VHGIHAYRFGIARGDQNIWHNSVGIGLGRIDAWGHQWNASDSSGVQNSVLDRVLIREVYRHASFGERPTITGNTVRESRLESYGTNATSGEGVAYVGDNIVSKVGSDTDIWNDVPIVTEGADVLFAGLGDDIVSAKGGDDLIMGGPGSDTLTGGIGRDRFLYIWSDEGIDTITDFAAGRDGDIIDVGFFLARAAGADYDGDPFSDGYVRVVKSGHNTLLQLANKGGGDGYATVAILQNVNAASLVDANWRLGLTR
jgi:Ca2+-binding RTX toxin-like protein